MSIERGNIPAEYFGTVSTSGHQAGAFSLREERDEMKMNWVVAAAVVAMSITAGAGAQSAKDMRQASSGENTSMTYTGCVVSVNHGGAFLLTNVDGGAAESMSGDKTMKHHDDMAMKHDDMAMKHDDMAMKHDAAGTMQHDQTPMADEKMDAMPSRSFALAGSTNVSKHVGQKVSVTGSLSEGSMGTTRQDVSTLTIKSLKVVAKSCS